ncbi:NAD(P)-dependent alcohol dehydrogenase [Cellulomonas sp. KRMCY2]|uniref:NAD(P)-dependent alcohol dehydrogenase n=1 Tax=Cellulomonas sp. KRMCY2 TaxID=1304865 RepID=UPI00045E7FD2|nr:NAD(P)-dependent alcohol dehydrogenase [Cellulomonas sp. KRMCY2]
MRAAVYRRFGGPSTVRVEEVPTPTPGRGDVLIKVYASTVSAADHRARSRDVPRGLRILAALSLGVFRPRRRVLGMDVAGVVTAVGADVTRFSPGDEVIAMLGARFGGHAEYACVPQDGAITAKPRTMTFEEAVTLVFGGITARAYLNQVDLRPGATVLANGASGAVGTAAVQLAKQAGAHVTGVCSGANRAMVTALGADRVIDYTTDDFTAEATTYDVIVDCVGNAPFERVGGLLNPGGALLLVIADLWGVLRAPWRSRRSGKLVTASVGTYRADDLALLVDLAESGRYRAVSERTYALSDIAEAHRFVDAGHKKGDVVLRVAAGTGSTRIGAACLPLSSGDGVG